MKPAFHPIWKPGGKDEPLVRIEDSLPFFREPISFTAKSTAKNATQAETNSDVVEISSFGADLDDVASLRTEQLGKLVQSENYRIDPALVSQRLIDNALSPGGGL